MLYLIRQTYTENAWDFLVSNPETTAGPLEPTDTLTATFERAGLDAP